jgi:hypothetical protein
VKPAGELVRDDEAWLQRQVVEERQHALLAVAQRIVSDDAAVVPVEREPRIAVPRALRVLPQELQADGRRAMLKSLNSGGEEALHLLGREGERRYIRFRFSESALDEQAELGGDEPKHHRRAKGMQHCLRLGFRPCDDSVEESQGFVEAAGRGRLRQRCQRRPRGQLRASSEPGELRAGVERAAPAPGPAPSSAPAAVIPPSACPGSSERDHSAFRLEWALCDRHAMRARG